MAERGGFPETESELRRLPGVGDYTSAAIVAIAFGEAATPIDTNIQRVVARQYNVSRADLLSSRRTANVVRPRQVAMYLAKTLTLRSLPEIGRRFGGRDHTTVLHAVRKIENLVTTDTALAEEIELLKRQLQE